MPLFGNQWRIQIFSRTWIKKRPNQGSSIVDLFFTQKGMMPLIRGGSRIPHRVVRQTIPLTRMHSSRMRTARLLPVSPSMHCYRGCTCPGGVPAHGGCTCPGGCTHPWGCTCLGVYLPRGVPAQVLPPCVQNF